MNQGRNSTALLGLRLSKVEVALVLAEDMFGYPAVHCKAQEYALWDST